MADGPDHSTQQRQLAAPALERLGDGGHGAETPANGSAVQHADGSGQPDGATCVHQLFEQQAQQRPQAVCLIAGDQRLGYGAVNAAANQLAHSLLAAGVAANVAVGVSMQKQPALYVSLLAVIKAGGCYMPLDPELPAQRAAAMLEQAGARLLLAGSGCSFSGLRSVQVVHVGDPSSADWQSGSLPVSNPPARCTAADLYSITYTRWVSRVTLPAC